MCQKDNSVIVEPRGKTDRVIWQWIAFLVGLFLFSSCFVIKVGFFFEMRMGGGGCIIITFARALCVLGIRRAFFSEADFSLYGGPLHCRPSLQKALRFLPKPTPLGTWDGHVGMKPTWLAILTPPFEPFIAGPLRDHITCGLDFIKDFWCIGHESLG